MECAQMRTRSTSAWPCFQILLVPHLERNACLLPAVDGDIDRVLAGIVEFELLDVYHEIADQEIQVCRDHDLHRHVDARHDEPPVFIDEIHFHFVGAFLDLAERDSKRDRALGMYGGKMSGHDRIERAEDIELASVIGRRVAQDSHLNVHDRVIMAHCGFSAIVVCQKNRFLDQQFSF